MNEASAIGGTATNNLCGIGLDYTTTEKSKLTIHLNN